MALDRVGRTLQTRPLPLSTAYVRRMLAHVVLPCADLQKSSSFYEAVLAPLGISKVFDKPEDVGFGAPGRPDFWLEGLLDGQQMRELHVAFRASSRSAVDQFFATAVAVGAQVLRSRVNGPSTTTTTSRSTTQRSCVTLTATTSRPSATSRLEALTGVHSVAAVPTTQHDVHCSVP